MEFADKEQFAQLLNKIQAVFKNLIDSFALGNVIKNGIPIAIVGEPNVGKSTLLNALLQEDRAIVSPIPGTTRDTIEDELVIGGIGFRFIDTAGIRETEDFVESIGIRKTHEKIEKARLVLYLADALEMSRAKKKGGEIALQISELNKGYPNKKILLVINKTDALDPRSLSGIREKFPDAMFISARENTGLESLKSEFLNLVNTGALTTGDTIISNSRHYNALLKARDELQKVQEGLEEGLSGDLLAVDIRQALYHLGEITGEITTDDLLGNIFANFCIGK